VVGICGVVLDCGIGDRLSRRSQGCLQHCVLDVSTAYFILARKGFEIDVGGRRRPGRVQLHLPNSDTFRLAWQLEEHVRSDTSLECRIEVRGKIGGEDHHTGVPVQLLQEHIDHGV
jgi:hypothetical protein